MSWNSAIQNVEEQLYLDGADAWNYNWYGLREGNGTWLPPRLQIIRYSFEYAYQGWIKLIVMYAIKPKRIAVLLSQIMRQGSINTGFEGKDDELVIFPLVCFSRS